MVPLRVAFAVRDLGIKARIWARIDVDYLRFTESRDLKYVLDNKGNRETWRDDDQLKGKLSWHGWHPTIPVAEVFTFLTTENILWVWESLIPFTWYANFYEQKQIYGEWRIFNERKKSHRRYIEVEVGGGGWR